MADGQRHSGYVRSESDGQLRSDMSLYKMLELLLPDDDSLREIAPFFKDTLANAKKHSTGFHTGTIKRIINVKSLSSDQAGLLTAANFKVLGIEPDTGSMSVSEASSSRVKKPFDPSDLTHLQEKQAFIETMKRAVRYSFDNADLNDSDLFRAMAAEAGVKRNSLTFLFKEYRMPANMDVMRSIVKAAATMSEANISEATLWKQAAAAWPDRIPAFITIDGEGSVQDKIRTRYLTSGYEDIDDLTSRLPEGFTATKVRKIIFDGAIADRSGELLNDTNNVMRALFTEEERRSLNGQVNVELGRSAMSLG